MVKKKVLVWETLATVSGGQKMTLTVMDMLSDQYDFCCLIPAEGVLSEELKKRNIPYVLMGDQTLPTGVKGKKVIFRYGWMSIKSIFKSLKQVRKYKPDILYCPGPAALPWSAVCGSLTRKPVVWHLHHIFLDGMTRKLLNHCGKKKCVKTIISVSDSVGNQITNTSAREKIKILYNPVDVQKYSNGDPIKIKKEIENLLGYELDSSHVIIGHVALIQEAKRQAFVLNVLSKLQQSGMRTIGLFAGECRDANYQQLLEKRVTELDLQRGTLFLGRRNDIPDFLCLLDVLIIPSFEGFPLAGLEAAAAGVPVAACGVAGAEEYIKVSGNGVCFEENSVSDAVSAIQSILDNRDSMISRGRVFAEKMSTSQYEHSIKSIFMNGDFDCHKHI